MITFNAQSIRNKMDEFRALITVEKPEIVGITETWIHTDTRDFVGEFELPGYSMFKKDRINKQGGGVMLYVREYLNPLDCKLDVDHEVLGILLNNLKKKLYIYIVYRPPHQLADKDLDLYNALENNIRNEMCIIIRI